VTRPEDIDWRRLAAATPWPRCVYAEETSRADAAAAEIELSSAAAEIGARLRYGAGHKGRGRRDPDNLVD